MLCSILGLILTGTVVNLKGDLIGVKEGERERKAKTQYISSKKKFLKAKNSKQKKIIYLCSIINL